MNQRRLGKTGRMVSEIGLGTWQLGTNGVTPLMKRKRKASWRPVMKVAST